MRAITPVLVHEPQSWHCPVMLDEARFHLSLDFKPMRILEGQIPEIRARKIIGSRRLLVTIDCNPHRFHVLNVFPKGQKLNAGNEKSELLLP
jgi:hypothetical protein